jgi:hypothetical protein
LEGIATCPQKLLAIIEKNQLSGATVTELVYQISPALVPRVQLVNTDITGQVEIGAVRSFVPTSR